MPFEALTAATEHLLLLRHALGSIDAVVEAVRRLGATPLDA